MRTQIRSISEVLPYNHQREAAGPAPRHCVAVVSSPPVSAPLPRGDGRPTAPQIAALLAGALAKAIIALMFLGILPVVGRAQPIPIERAQREFQARYYYLTGGCAVWPTRGSTPATFFPPDGFYGDTSKDPMLLRDVVRDLANKFYNTAIIYNQFLNPTNNQPYTAGDMSAIVPSNIDQYNYPSNCVAILKDIQKLQYFPNNPVRPIFKIDPDPQPSTCQTCSAAAVSARAGSVDYRMDLGRGGDGKGVGWLVVHADMPTNALFTPAGLQLCATNAFGFTNSTTHWLSQVLGPQSLIDVVTNSATSYVLSFYPAGTNYLTNIYNAPQGSPFKTIQVEQNGSTNSLKLTETAEGATYVTTYTYVPAASQWNMVGGTSNELRTESRTSTWDANTNRTDTFVITDASNRTNYVEVNYYSLFQWGEEKVQQIIGVGTSYPLTNRWSYYTNRVQDGDNYGRLKQFINATNHWERYEYNSDGFCYITVSQIGNADPTALDGQSRVLGVWYGDWYGTPTEVRTESIQGQPVAITALEYMGNLMYQFECQTNGGFPFNSDGALLTRSYWYVDSNYLPTSQLQKVIHPDNTLSTYATDVDVTTGQGDSSYNTVVNGTHNATQIGPRGETRSVVVAQIRQGFSGVQLVSEIHQNDALGRSTNISNLGGLAVDRHYGCCGVDWETDQGGVTTNYEYDSLKRLVLTTRNGITISNSYDGAGRIIVVTRLPSDNSAPIVLKRRTYDTAGRLTSETDALGVVTLYTNYWDNGFWASMTTYAAGTPDEAARIERYYQDGRLYEVTGTAMHPVRYLYGLELDNGLWRPTTTEIKLAQDGGTNEWAKSYMDMLGRVYKVVYPDGAARRYFFNNLGQLAKEIDPDNVITLYQYNAKGEREYTAIDLNLNGQMDFSNVNPYGTDRITRTVNDAFSDFNTNVQSTQVYGWDTWNDAIATLDLTTETSADGLQAWEMIRNGYAYTKSTQTAYDRPNQRRTVTVTAADGTKTVRVYQSGLLRSETRTSASGNIQLGQMLFNYDGHGRLQSQTDARNGTTTYTYNNADQVTSVTTPPPVSGQPGQTTVTQYDNRGRPVIISQPDLTTVTNRYYPSGELQLVAGSRTYPVAYTYDAQGRMTTNTTWQNYAANSGVATTTWSYNSRGWLISKNYSATNGPTFTYTPGGRLRTRTWARGLTTTYTYGFDQYFDSNYPYGYINYSADLVHVTYSDGTPSVTIIYDRRGQPQRIVRSDGPTTVLAYAFPGHLQSENNDNSLTVSYSYDSFMRPQYLSVNCYPAYQRWFNYDSESGRLLTVSDGWTNTVTYSYLANSDLIGQITYAVRGPTQWDRIVKMSTTRQYDNLNRLEWISSSPAAGLAVSYNYGYNSANQRFQATLADGSAWFYQYDALGQMRSGKKYWPNGTRVPGQQFEYVHDDIGNRTLTKVGGDQSGAGLRPAGYTANLLNQYSSRQVSTNVDVMGLANFDANLTVSINGSTQAVYWHNDYFQASGPAGNDAGPAWTPVQVSATRSTNTVQQPANPPGHLLVPPATQNFLYDADGNLTNDLIWSYTWDGENRLIKMDCLVSGPSAQHLTFDYDWQGRRIRKLVQSGAYTTISDIRFLYDGWNPIAELDALHAPPALTLLRSYLWGTDLSGNLQGAGGIGGLLEVNDVVTGANFVSFDGNGNVTALIKGADGTVSARYEYGPFGELIRATGSMAMANPLRWSTKYWDDETDLVYYGYRYYLASLGRWLNRDPIEEMGGNNLYAFTHNNPVNLVDVDGRLLPAIAVGGISIGAVEAAAAAFGISVTACLVTPSCRNMALRMAQSATQDAVDAVARRLPQRRCNPCIPPVGTIGVRIDIVPPARPHFPFTGSHIHWYDMQQEPIMSPNIPCRCFWHDMNCVTGGTTLPPGTIPATPPAGGGVGWYWSPWNGL